MKALITSLLIVLVSPVAMANTCESNNNKVTKIFTRFTDGMVNITLNGSAGGYYLCKLEEDFNSISAKECQLLYSKLLAAQIANKRVDFIFQGDSCNPAPNSSQWVAVDLYGMRLVNE